MCLCMCVCVCVCMYMFLSEELPSHNSQIIEGWKKEQQLSFWRKGGKVTHHFYSEKRECVCACPVIDVNLSLQYSVNTSLASRNNFIFFFHLSYAVNETEKSPLWDKADVIFTLQIKKKKKLNTCKTWMHCYEKIHVWGFIKEHIYAHFLCV